MPIPIKQRSKLARKAFAAWIKQYGVHVGELAIAMEYTRGALDHILSGRRNVSRNFIARLKQCPKYDAAPALAATLTAILNGESE